MPIPESNSHLPLRILWIYRHDTSVLTREQSRHVSHCDKCETMLGVCAMSETVEDAAALFAFLDEEKLEA
jgi:hypothetical protein